MTFYSNEEKKVLSSNPLQILLHPFFKIVFLHHRQLPHIVHSISSPILAFWKDRSFSGSKFKNNNTFKILNK